MYALIGFIQDSTGSGTPTGNVSLGAAFLALKGLLIPGIATFLFKQWNVAKGAMDGTPNLLKGVLFIIVSLVVGTIATFAGQAVGADPNTWTESTIASLLGGLIGTLQVKAGIATAKEKGVVPSASVRR